MGKFLTAGVAIALATVARWYLLPAASDAG